MVLMYTGGTTGVAKGVLLEQRAEMLNLYHIGMAVDFGEGGCICTRHRCSTPRPWAGIVGIPATGGSSVFVPLFEPEQVMQAIEQYRVDWTMMVPTMIAMVINDPDSAGTACVAASTSSTAPRRCRRHCCERLMTTFPDLNMWQGYGMTECSSVLTFLTAADHRHGGNRSCARRGDRRWASHQSCADGDDTEAAPARTARSSPVAATSCVSTGAGPKRPKSVPQRLVSHRRRRSRRREGVPVHRRPGQRHDRHRWRERVLDRGRERDLHSPSGRPSRGDRDSRTTCGANRSTRRRAAARGAATGGRDHGARPGHVATTRCRSRSSSEPSRSRCPAR